MSNTRYKELGTNIAKLYSTAQNGLKSYIASGNEFYASDDVTTNRNKINAFANETFLMKATFNANGKETKEINFDGTDSYMGTPNEFKTGNRYAILKDGNRVAYQFNLSLPHANDSVRSRFNADKYGDFLHGQFMFVPNIKRIADNDQKVFRFRVTEKGYLIPYDPCTKAIYDNNWEVKSSFYKSGGACYNQKTWTSAHW